MPKIASAAALARARLLGLANLPMHTKARKRRKVHFHPGFDTFRFTDPASLPDL